MVFCGLFPIDTDRYEDLRDALDRLALNDAALSYEPETSQALGFGFRCGFLGLLHMDIVRERLEREYDLELLATTPNVRYEVELRGGEPVEVRSPAEMPDPATIEESPRALHPRHGHRPGEHVGAVMELCQGRRGTHVDMHYLSPERVQLRYDLPLAEIVLDFYDLLKSRTAGYASLDYEPIGNRASDLVKLDVLLAGERVDALSVIVHSDDAYRAGKALVERLQKTIPRQLFDVPVQAAIGSRVLARETVKALRKDVTAKLYGGDVTRKRKLLEKQKTGQEADEAGGARSRCRRRRSSSVLELDESEVTGQAEAQRENVERDAAPASRRFERGDIESRPGRCSTPRIRGLHADRVWPTPAPTAATRAIARWIGHGSRPGRTSRSRSGRSSRWGEHHVVVEHAPDGARQRAAASTSRCGSPSMFEIDDGPATGPSLHLIATPRRQAVRGRSTARGARRAA